MNIIIKLAPGANKPLRGSEGAAGWDLYSNEPNPIFLKPGERYTFKTGVSVVLPRGTYLKIESRSGLANKFGLHTIGGVIDEDYRNEIGVILVNSGFEEIEVLPGTRIAQVILHSYFSQNYVTVDELPNDTKRGLSGFGSTGNL
jgi:dUTP pyrophosphatase